MLLTAALAMIGLQNVPSRFQPAWPLPGLPSVVIDTRQAMVGVAQETAAQRRLQGRVLWIDGTANLERCSSDEKIAALMAKVRAVGFNTVVYDIKPIVGRTLYPSKLTEKMTSWKGQTMPLDYDPLAAMVREAHAQGLSLLVSMNAFAEGHSYAKRDADKPDSLFGAPGWGYERPELQSWTLRTRVTLSFGSNTSLSFTAPLNTMEGAMGLFTVLPRFSSKVAYTSFSEDGVILSIGTERPSAGSFYMVTKFLPDDQFPAVGERAIVSQSTEFVPAAENQGQIPLMMSPHSKEIQERTFSFVEEVFQNYEVDGLLFDDRLRYAGLEADFSPIAREQFEKQVGRAINWPDDIYRPTINARLQQGIEPGPFFDEWLTWRAQTLTDWVKNVKARVPKGKTFGIYAGSWYGGYAEYGNNYGSDQLQAGFPFLTRYYQKTGFASSLDLLVTGCYYPTPTIVDAMKVSGPIGRTVEAAGVVSNRVARDQCWTYAGLMLSDYDGDPSRLGAALQAACATSQGVMVFDLSHKIDQFWDVFERAFSNDPKKAPHQAPGLIQTVRNTRLTWEKNGWKEPPFPFFPGAPGAGF